jgi:hypothetical protein
VGIAERALGMLAADGMAVQVAPSTLIRPASGSRRQRLQGDWTYVYRRLKEQARVVRGAAGRARRAVRAASARSDS